MAKVCLFCGDPAGSREHIFAQWLIERMGADGMPFVVAWRSGEEKIERPPHGLLAFTTRHVCRECNNGWMSDLEGEFGKNVGMLVERQWPRLSATLLYLAAEHGELIGKWALKILVCIGKAGAKAKKIGSDEMAHALKDGKLPADFYVRLGHLKNPGIGTIINPYVHARHGTVLRRRAHRDGVAFKAVIALNHLAVGISSAPEMKQTFVPFEGALPVMAYPEKENSERENYSFHDAGTFEACLEFAEQPR